MSALQILSISSSSYSQKRVHDYAAINVPKLQRVRILLPKNLTSWTKLVYEFNGSLQTIVPSQTFQLDSCNPNKCRAIIQLHSILKAVVDRVEMHKNIGEQHKNWNSLLWNCINIMTVRLNTSIHNTAFKLTSTLLLIAAKGMIRNKNKIQTSQQKAVTLFNQLQTDIQATLTRTNPSDEDVNSTVERVLALDKAYPLPLSSGTKFEKIPSKFEPRTNDDFQMKVLKSQKTTNNGWSPELEKEMREILEVVKRKDIEEYEKRGNLALKITKTLTILGPVLTGIAALGSAFEKNGSSWAGIVAVMAGSLADFIKALEGIVFEMYKNCGRFIQDTIEATLEEKNYEKRENGELFEKKEARKLGRSVSQLRQLASKFAGYDLGGADFD
ncbi:hypothetical protein QN277_001192 [Acacia crassicarpa]|uniref:Uncharacterized protein n=1 Tax=Acacia crassicarpa TaxID=499986 RepID=A0AAE1TGT3_9FABA|nr:hypothetical protein QN277_001192 [Acacia crassicarpa]